jgi:hypothetical protein
VLAALTQSRLEGLSGLVNCMDGIDQLEASQLRYSSQKRELAKKLCARPHERSPVPHGELAGLDRGQIEHIVENRADANIALHAIEHAARLLWHFVGRRGRGSPGGLRARARAGRSAYDGAVAGDGRYPCSQGSGGRLDGRAVGPAVAAVVASARGLGAESRYHHVSGCRACDRRSGGYGCYRSRPSIGLT